MAWRDRRFAVRCFASAVLVATFVASALACSDSKRSQGNADAKHRATQIPLSSLRGRVVFSGENDDDIWIAAPDGTKAHRITATAGPEEDPSWSPDGSKVVYRDSRRGYNANDEIYVVNSDGSGRRNLTRTTRNEWGPAWSPDGKLIAFNADLQLYVMRPDGTGVRRITDRNGEYPAWSPDGRRLAFMSGQPDARGSDPNYDIFVVGVDGTGLKQLTTWSHEDGWPAWSPDGRWIAYTSTRDNHGQLHGAGGPYTAIYLMRPDGSAKRRLLYGVYGTLPTWSPDGRMIMFGGSRLSRFDVWLWVIRSDGSGLRRVPLHGGIADWSAR
jgi:TolB protein